MNRKILKIGNRIVSDKHHPLIIAEIGQTHNGSIEKAFKFIDKIKLAGGDAVKFQLHIASEESTLDEPFRVKIKNFKSDMIIGRVWNLQMRNGLKFLNIVKKDYFLKLSFFKKRYRNTQKSKNFSLESGIR